MKIIPLGKYVLIKQYITPTQSKIILSAEPPRKNLAYVVDCGDECQKLWVEGSLIQYLNYQTIPVENEEDLFLVKEENILAIHYGKQD